MIFLTTPMKKIISVILCSVLTLSMIFGLSGCDKREDTGSTAQKKFKSRGQSVDLMEGIKSTEDKSDYTCGTCKDTDAAAFTDFAVKLFQQAASDKNTLISPLSVVMALSMAMNGADSETLRQYEATYGISIDDINYFSNHIRSNLKNDKNTKLTIADSIWIKKDDGLTVNKDFLQTNANFYGAGIFKSPFDDGTVADINKWVSDNTDGMIPQMLDKIDKDAVMFLINALCFDAKWEEPYLKTQISNEKFTNIKGEKQKASYMTSNESIYIETEHATGFAKPYYSGRYAFVGILPNEDISLGDYIEKYAKEDIEARFRKFASFVYNLPSGATLPSVNATIPKFKTEFSQSLNKDLRALGITDAFNDKKADFTKLGNHVEGNIYIGNVLHKTFIEVGEHGTKAGAATSVEMVKETAAMDPIEPKTVRLDRPFMYMILDVENEIPVFIGTVTAL